MLPPSGPVKSKPLIIPDHGVNGLRLSRASSTRNQSPVCVCQNMLTTCWDKGCVGGKPSQDVELSVAAGGISSAEIRNMRDERNPAHLPGCAHGLFSAATPSTGRTAWWTCCCSRTPACEPNPGTAWVPAAGWSSAHRAEDHMSCAAATLRRGGEGGGWGGRRWRTKRGR